MIYFVKSIYPYVKNLLMVVMHNNTVFCKIGHDVKYGAVLVKAFKDDHNQYPIYNYSIFPHHTTF